MKIIPQLDTDPRLVGFGQTAPGKAAMLGAFALLLLANHVNLWIELTLALVPIAYFPARRRLLASMAALYWLFFHSTWLNWTFLRALAKTEGQKTDWTLTVLVCGILAAVFCGLAIFFRYVRCVRSRRNSLAAKRPVLCLMASYAAVLATAGMLPLSGMMRLLVWAVIAVTAPYLWYFAYALKDALAKTPDGAILQFGTLQPFWGGTNVPYPKGAANLRRIEAQNSEDLSITQLKAIKLLSWVFILHMLLLALRMFVYGEPIPGLRLGFAQWSAPNLGVPELDVALQQAAVPVHVAWASVIAHFAQALLQITVSGNTFIAFKELLVDFSRFSRAFSNSIGGFACSPRPWRRPLWETWSIIFFAITGMSPSLACGGRWWDFRCTPFTPRRWGWGSGFRSCAATAGSAHVATRSGGVGRSRRRACCPFLPVGDFRPGRAV